MRKVLISGTNKRTESHTTPKVSEACLRLITQKLLTIWHSRDKNQGFIMFTNVDYKTEVKVLTVISIISMIRIIKFSIRVAN